MSDEQVLEDFQESSQPCIGVQLLEIDNFCFK